MKTLKDLIKIYVYTFCYNELDLSYFVIDYWKQFATKVIVYDNYSNDNTLYILLKYPELIEIRKYNSNNTYNPLLIQEMKNTIWKECINTNIDYVYICDFDEVPLLNEENINKLIYCKNNNIDIIYSKYYEGYSNKIILYNKDILFHEYPETNFMLTDIHKCMLFNPNKIKNSCFNNYSRIFIIKDNILDLNILLDILHLKYYYLEISRINYIENINRYKDNDLSFLNLYGKNISEYYIKFDKLLNYSKYNKNNFLKLDKKENIINKSKDLSFLNSVYNIKFPENISITNLKYYNNKCVIIIPVYKIILSKYEIASLKQCIKLYKDKYDICIVGPYDLNIEYYKCISNYFDFSYILLPNEYFYNIRSYSFLCETYLFYELFNKFKYLLIYLLDAWIFEDKLEYFIDMDYDYIGSPWKKGVVDNNNDNVGNGGLCLRKVLTFINLCKNTNFNKFTLKELELEDILFCMNFKDILNIATVEIAMQFAWTNDIEYWLSLYKHMPMGVHAWNVTPFNKFWYKYIKIE